MTLERLTELFDEHNDEYMSFDNVHETERLSDRRDMHAMILLDTLLPGDGHIISASEHDVIYLGVGLEELVEVISEEQIIQLIRCGVLFDEHRECFTMFV